MIKIMSLLAAALMASLALLLSGCGGTEPIGAEPGDGPAESMSSEPTDPDPGHGEPTGPVEGEGEPEEGDGEPTGAFNEKIVYPDGVEVEFTKIKTGKVTAEQSEYSDVKKGTDYVVLTLRIRNGSKVKLDLISSISVSYGPDGETGEQWYYSDIADSDLPTGTLLPGKAKTGAAIFLIPAKHQGDVTAEVSLSMEHATAIFTGSVE